MNYESNIVLSENQYKVVGTRPVRHDGVDKVTGRALYGADIHMPQLIYGKILRSPHAHARILSINVDKLIDNPLIEAVVTCSDLPEMEPGQENASLKYLRDNVIASDKVLYKGQPVAAVAAKSSHDAEEALTLIEVEYEILNPVTTAYESIYENTTVIHEDLNTTETYASIRNPRNIASHIQHSIGDVYKGFEECDVTVEKEFHTKTVHQGYIEPHNATAFWNKDGRLTIWRSTQGPFEVRETTARILNIDVSSIKVVPLEIGGGFGGKFDPYGDPVAALLSKKSGKPVKIVMSRSEDLESTGPTPGSYIKIRIGANTDGRILAAEALLAYEAGAYPGSPVDSGALCIFAAYDIPNLEINGYDVVVNKPKTAAYRAPGATNAAFATETVIDEIAEKLNIDSLDLRIKNAAKEGTRRPDGPIHPKIGSLEVLKAMKEHHHFNTPINKPNEGRGIAIGYWMNGGGPASCTLQVNYDGTINLNEGSPDIGGTRTSVAMQAAEVLGLQAEDIFPSVLDTDAIGYTSGTGGSSVTFKTGRAAYDAALDLKRKLMSRAARIWDVDITLVAYQNGEFIAGIDHASNPEQHMTFRELAEQLEDTGGPITGSANTNGEGEGGAFAGCIVDAKVDPETGKVDITRFTIIQDVGKAIHPSYVEGQMQGGSVQGIGWAMNEEYIMDNKGHMMNSNLLDYRMPTSLDIPMIDTVIVEVPNPRHPYGVRGVGEVSIIMPPAAIANAIYQAVGIRLNNLPMNPETVMKGIWSSQE
ncbi:MAG: xanthine dehydrogenase family protein molybdopterin-binding subunit [SAR202 cluster bacterium]|nr:xanthine dehydrogenase family protein molybdopterin-binding subunit [SAR202 cluster bacterium]